MSEAKITSKGSITIPADIRKGLGVATGDRMVFSRLEDGTVILRAKSRSIQDLKGMLKSATKRKISTNDMRMGRK